MAAVAAGCRKALASTGLTISLLSCTNERRKYFLYLVGTPILAFWAVWRIASFPGSHAEKEERGAIPEYFSKL